MDDDWWLQHIFGRPLAAKTNPNDAQRAAEVSPREALDLMTRLFTNCGAILASFTDQQVAEGLVFLGSSGESDWMYYIYDPSIDRTARYECIRSIEAVFRDCFARRCPNPFGKQSSDLNSLDNVCFMWWDRFPSCGRSTTRDEAEAVNLKLVDVMAKTLQIENVACQMSALHGLGHFGGPDVKRAQIAIDDWLVSHSCSALRSYAEAAREGNVQ